MKIKTETITSGPLVEEKQVKKLELIEGKAQDLYDLALKEFGHSPEMVEAFKAIKVFTYWVGQAAQDA